jgi:ABC-type branched-subunit amino acid transport system ATPase component
VAEPAPVLEVDRLTAGYGGLPVVREASFTVARGQVVSILGPNGAGKSTLLKGVFGLIDRLGGTVRLMGRDISRLRPDQMVGLGMGYVPQTENVFPSLTVDENLRMGAYLHRAQIPRRREEVLAVFGDLRGALSRRAGTLSGGQRNMLAMARGLMAAPQVLLLDEPTAGLAPQVAAEVWRKVRQIAAAGTAVALVEQNVAMALQYSDYAYVLVGGTNRYEAPSREAEREDLGAMFLGT